MCRAGVVDTLVEVGTGRVVLGAGKYPTSRKGREKWGTRRGDRCVAVMFCFVGCCKRSEGQRREGAC
jgi:hypothetical protein